MAYNPKYSVAIIHSDTKYDVTEAVTNLTLQESDGEIAQRVTLSLANVKVNGQYLSGIFTFARDSVTLCAISPSLSWSVRLVTASVTSYLVSE